MEAFQAKLNPFDSAWIAWRNDTPAGYLFTIPMKNAGALVLPSLSATEKIDCPSDANCLYLHDLAVVPTQRGSGISRMLFEAAWGLAKQRNLDQMALIAVQGSQSFWQSLGFASVQQPSAIIESKLATYGSDAALMTRSTSDCA